MGGRGEPGRPDRNLLLVAALAAPARAIRSALGGSASPFTLTEAPAEFEGASLPAERYAAVLVCCPGVTPAALDLVRRCRNLAGPPVVVITEPGVEGRAVEFVAAGADDWVSSAPDNLAALGRVLDNAIARHAAERDVEKRYRQEVGWRLEHSETLLTLARAVNSTLELPEVLRRTTRELVRVLRADIGGAWIQAQDGRFVPCAGYRVPPDLLQKLLTYSVPADHPVVEAASRLSSPFVSADSQADPLLDFEALRAIPHRSVVILPMWAKNGPIGGFILSWTRGPCDFDDDHLRLADAVARNAASAVENARLYAENTRLYQAELHRRQEAEALVTMASMLARAADVDTVCRHAAESVQALFAASGCQVRLVQPDGSFAVAAASGSATPVAPTLAVPLRSEGQEVGELVLHGGRSRGEADMTVLQAFADAAGLALERARFVATIQDRAREAQLVADLARAVNTTLDPTMVMIHLAETARLLCRADLGGVALRDPVTGIATFCHPIPGDVSVRFEPGKGLGGLAMVTGRAVRSDNYLEDPRANNRDFVAALGMASVMAVPVKLGDRVEALIYLGNVSRRPFTDLDESRVLRLAEHAAVAIRNVELIAAERRARAELEASTEALRQSEERYRELVENASDAVFTLDLAGNFTSTNRAGIRLTGYALDELERMNMAHVLAPEFLPRAAELLGIAGMGKLPEVFECEIITKDGRRVAVEVQGTPQWQGGRVVGLQGIGRDVTERRRLEEQLRQAQKMDAVGRLAGGVAHDFNNLLTVIQGRADLLLERIGPVDPLRNHLELIRRTAGRAADLTHRLLAFSRRQVLRPRVLDLNAVLRDLAPMLRSLIREDIELSLETAPGIVRVLADPGQLEHVVINLAVNARDAMPRGGRLSIAIGVDGGGGPGPGPSPAERQRPQATLQVGDTGHGMDAQTRARVFEPFFTTKEIGKGTGLGLATVYGIVTQSGGLVTVDSALGHGTTFTVFLPIVEDELSGTAGTDERREPPGGRERILIVEDEQAVLALATDILQSRGYTVVSMSGSEEALAWIQQHPSSIDLLLTDIVMPRMNGPELATRIQALCPGVRVVYMSGYTADAIGHHGTLDSGTAFLQKPFTPKELSRTIREVLDAVA